METHQVKGQARVVVWYGVELSVEGQFLSLHFACVFRKIQ